jgi:hypothetical protein
MRPAYLRLPVDCLGRALSWRLATAVRGCAKCSHHRNKPGCLCRAWAHVLCRSARRGGGMGERNGKNAVKTKCHLLRLTGGTGLQKVNTTVQRC